MSKIMRNVVLCATLTYMACSPVLAQNVCDDQYMAAQIAGVAEAAAQAEGICPTAKAGIKLYTKSIQLVNNCLHIDSLRNYKIELEQLLQQSKQIAQESCSG